MMRFLSQMFVVVPGLVLGIGSVYAQPKPPLQSADVVDDAPSPFASRVIAYTPGDGEFVNDPAFNDPARALGAPVGGGTYEGDLTKLVTLGDFGGSITLGFDQTIRDDPLNPFGLDAIVFGNGFWVGNNPNLKWAEAGVIEISRDTNGNGVADDPWYVIPGSDIIDPMTQREGELFILPDDPFARPPLFNEHFDGTESFFGYADMSPVLILGDLDGDNIVDDPDLDAARFYTVPDDPDAVGVSPGSGGGDAFDIAWAVDPDTNLPAELDGFDFIRITTAARSDTGGLGEVSVEVGAVAAVRHPSRIGQRLRGRGAHR